MKHVLAVYLKTNLDQYFIYMQMRNEQLFGQNILSGGKPHIPTKSFGIEALMQPEKTSGCGRAAKRATSA